jgi:hypothetical protein
VTGEPQTKREEAIKFQAAWGCAPASGLCFNCGNDIYAKEQDRKQAMEQVVTGCPHCHYSFVD